MSTLTALQVLDDRAVVATRSCDAARDMKKQRGERVEVDTMSYRNGQAIAFLDAKKIMEAELRRLCNRFQNGMLSVDDFGINL
jgi:hypothetical protein